MTSGINQCTGCGSESVTQRSFRAVNGGLPPVTDIETVLACNDCGRNIEN